MTMLRTTHSLIAVLTFVLLLSAFRGELRVALNGVDGPSLALAIPVLVIAALTTALSSAATALVLEIVALILMGLYLAEEGFALLPVAGAVGLVIMGALSLGLVRTSPEIGD